MDAYLLLEVRFLDAKASRIKNGGGTKAVFSICVIYGYEILSYDQIVSYGYSGLFGPLLLIPMRLTHISIVDTCGANATGVIGRLARPAAGHHSGRGTPTDSCY